MKRIFNKIVCHFLYHVGDFVSKTLISDKDFMYPLQDISYHVYNYCMAKSMLIDEAYDFGVWSHPVKYHCPESCNYCGGENEFTHKSYEEGRLLEATTMCKDCGEEDYWAYGFFESSSYQEPKCKTYSFGKVTKK